VISACILTHTCCTALTQQILVWARRLLRADSLVSCQHVAFQRAAQKTLTYS
jgi:hypothetical protein